MCDGVQWFVAVLRIVSQRDVGAIVAENLMTGRLDLNVSFKPEYVDIFLR
jgi:hypothetical protein